MLPCVGTLEGKEDMDNIAGLLTLLAALEYFCWQGMGTGGTLDPGSFVPLLYAPPLGPGGL